MSELDDLYVRLKALWESEPEDLEQKEPLLARAFAEQQTDQTPAKRVYDRHIEKLQAELRRANQEREDARMLAQEQTRRLTKDLQEADRLNGLLTDDVADRDEKIKELTREPVLAQDEAEALSGLGWRKG